MEKQIKIDENVGLLPEEESMEMSTPTDSVEISAEMTMLDFLVRDADNDIFRQAKKIKEQMASLASSLTRAAQKMEAFIVAGDALAWHGVNSLGEVQSSGASIDNAIGKLDGLRDGRAYLKYALEPVRKES